MVMNYQVNLTLNLRTMTIMPNRHQIVVLDGVASTPVNITSGVPQGSIFSHLLFNIVMNSISKLPLFHNANLILYADDVLLYKPVDTAADINPAAAVDSSGCPPRTHRQPIENSTFTPYQIQEYPAHPPPQGLSKHNRRYDMELRRTKQISRLGYN